MTLQKWIEDRAIHGFPTFSVEDVRAADLCSSEQILQNELSRLCSNKTIASVYRGGGGYLSAAHRVGEMRGGGDR